MSIKKIFLFIILTSSAIALGLYYTKSMHAQPTKSFPTFAGADQSIYTNRGVVDRIIQVDLSDDQQNNSQQIVAEVTMPFDFDGTLEYRWILAENVQLIAGSLTGEIVSLKANVPKKLILQVSGFVHSENRHIGFEISGEKNSRKIYGESLLASRSDKSFENIVQNVERIKASRSDK